MSGCNLIILPDATVMMGKMGFLSPDSQCYSFDHRANGYARGEGFGVIILKRLTDALQNGDTIRAVIRSTGSSQDGTTPGITQPNVIAQASLIRDTYAKAGLSLARTAFFEAHATGNLRLAVCDRIHFIRQNSCETGTPVGDPTEAAAIGAAFAEYRSLESPLIVYVQTGLCYLSETLFFHC